jgi:hypothetical protein
MFIRKPKDLTKSKNWFGNSDKMKKETPPAQFGCKRRYITKKNTLGIEYTKFPKDTNWWNLEKMFGAEHIGESYLSINLKKGFKTLKDDNGLILYKDGTWNCCTVLPYNEYRVAKVTAEATPAYDSPYLYNSGHKYDVTVYLELPLMYLLENALRTTVMCTRRFFSGVLGVFKSFKYTPEEMKRGWEYGWRLRLDEI